MYGRTSDLREQFPLVCCADAGLQLITSGAFKDSELVQAQGMFECVACRRQYLVSAKLSTSGAVLVMSRVSDQKNTEKGARQRERARALKAQ